MDVRLDGKVAVVTGGTGSLGSAIAKRLAESGAAVALIARDADKLAAAEAELSKAGKVKGITGDLTNISETPALVGRIRAAVGEIDILVNSAAVMVGGDALEVTEETWDRAFALNPKGMFFIMREIVKQSMKPRKCGSIVNISSMAGVRGMAQPLCGAVYSATKGAVNALTMQAAAEWGQYDVKCNALAPGAIEPDAPRPTPPAGEKQRGGPPMAQMAPLGHSCKQSEITAMVCYLASDCNKSITGQIIIMDGGSSVLGF